MSEAPTTEPSRDPGLTLAFAASGPITFLAGRAGSRSGGKTGDAPGRDGEGAAAGDEAADAEGRNAGDVPT